MTGSAGACRLTVNVICWGNAGQVRIAAISGRPSSPLIRRLRSPSDRGPSPGFQALPGLRWGRPCGWAAGLLLRGLRPDRPAAAKAGVYAEKAEVMCGKLGPGKPADYKAFRGRFGGRLYVSMARPHFSKMLSTSPRCHFWTLCPEVAAYLIMTRRRYSGRKSRLCDPPHDPV